MPDIFLVALDTINTQLRRNGECEIRPTECLVFEDSVPGVEAARRAKMQVVWVPHPGLLAEYTGREPEVLAGLTGEHKEDNEEGIGSLHDGWGKFYPSLVGFPLDTYGISIASRSA